MYFFKKAKPSVKKLKTAKKLLKKAKHSIENGPKRAKSFT